MARKLVLLFDGTWNTKRNRTNVVRLRRSIASTGESDPQQPCFYASGVGTRWYDRITGGFFGRGLSDNILDGYAWLARTYRPGDEVFVFGYSRGAYTARSFVGLVRKCGVLLAPGDEHLIEAYDLYRNKDIAPDAEPAQSFRAAHAREIRVRFVGVWDTVGALGIPVSHVPFSRDYYRWHDTELSKIVDYAYHAIALDEHREDYDVTVWTRAKPENLGVEQRWFVGAHSDVGGAADDTQSGILPNIPLRWMQDKAEAAGLVFSAKTEVGAQDGLARVSDSYREFLYGAYKVVKDRFQRRFGKGTNETVDPSVWARWRANPKYRPPSLRTHPERPQD